MEPRNECRADTGSDSVDPALKEFEQCWVSGRRPRIEDFLHRVASEPGIALTRALVRVELQYRRQSGECPELAEYAARFPSLAAILPELFDPPIDGSAGDSRVAHDLIPTVGAPDGTVDEKAAPPAGRGDIAPDVTRDWIHENAVDADGESLNDGSPVGGGPRRSFGEGRYQIKKMLGGGGQKTAFLARDAELDRDVVIALLRLDTADQTSLARLRDEARAMARLDDHPNIVGIHDLGEQDNQPYVVLQYVEGGSVADLLRTRNAPLPIDEAARIGEQVCQALEYAHRNDIVHRDVKPDNVWLTAGGIAKLGDFGLAVPLDRSRISGAGAPVGTAAYMPPEQALGSNVGPRSDLYSLGVMLYEMVTGAPPFRGDTFVQVISRHLNTAPVPPSWRNPEVGPSLNGLILQLLAKVMEDRPRTAAAVREILLAIVETSEVATPEPASRERTVEQLAGGVFVGRHKEMEELRAGLDEAIAGRGQLLLLTGEPGSGKTRTAEEARTYARLRSMEVHHGRCFEDEGAPAFWPWVQIIRSHASGRDTLELVETMGPAAADIAVLDAELRRRLPKLAAPPALEPEQVRFRLFDGVTSFLRRAAERRSMMLILDDLQWADEASLKLLEFLSSEIKDASLAVLGTYRNIDLGRRHPLTKTLAALAGESHCRRIELSGLSQSEIGQIVLSTSGARPPEGLLAAVWEKTEGNPFFVSEIIRLLVERGQLEHAGGDVEGLAIPDTVREVVGRRLDQLSEQCASTLTVASAIGREFALDVVERVAKVDADDVLDAMDEAEAARLVAEAPGGDRYAFVHDLIRETLYAEIRKARRRALHTRIGEAIEELHARDLEAHLPELAHHYFRAARMGEARKAVDYATRAGRHSLEGLSYEEAARFCEMALKALPFVTPLDEGLSCELQLTLGEARRKAGQLAAAIGSFERAGVLAKRLKRPEQQALATLGFFDSNWHIGALGEEAVTFTEEALEALADDDSPIRARVLSASAKALRYVRRLDVGRTRADEAVEMARRIGDPELLAYTLASLVEFLWGPENARPRLALAMEHSAASRQLGRGERMLESYIFRLLCHFELGQADDGRAIAGDLARLSEELRLPFFCYASAAVETMQALLEGRFDDAPRLAKEARRIGQRVRPDDVGATYGMHMFTLCKEKGQLKQIALAVNQLAREPSSAAKWRPALALIFAELDFREKAREEFEKLAASRFAEIPQDGLWTTSMSYLTEVCRYLKDSRRAALLYELLKTHAGLNIVAGGAVVCYGSASRYLGQLAMTLGRWADAEKHFQEALEMNERLGARPYLARTRHEYAELLLTRRDEGDQERAADLLRESLIIARELGMASLEKQILAVAIDSE